MLLSTFNIFVKEQKEKKKRKLKIYIYRNPPKELISVASITLAYGSEERNRGDLPLIILAYGAIPGGTSEIFHIVTYFWEEFSFVTTCIWGIYKTDRTLFHLMRCP